MWNFPISMVPQILQKTIKNKDFAGLIPKIHRCISTGVKTFCFLKLYYCWFVTYYWWTMYNNKYCHSNSQNKFTNQNGLELQKNVKIRAVPFIAILQQITRSISDWSRHVHRKRLTACFPSYYFYDQLSP